MGQCHATRSGFRFPKSGELLDNKRRDSVIFTKPELEKDQPALWPFTQYSGYGVRRDFKVLLVGGTIAQHNQFGSNRRTSQNDDGAPHGGRSGKSSDRNRWVEPAPGDESGGCLWPILQLALCNNPLRPCSHGSAHNVPSIAVRSNRWNNSIDYVVTNLIGVYEQVIDVKCQPGSSVTSGFQG